MTIAFRHYDVIVSPLITEKATALQEHNQFVFKVALRSTKKEISEAIEALFKVKVVKVRTMIVKGKKKFFRGVKGQCSDFKKAIVTLSEGDTIDVTTGL